MTLKEKLKDKTDKEIIKLIWEQADDEVCLGYAKCIKDPVLRQEYVAYYRPRALYQEHDY